MGIEYIAGIAEDDYRAFQILVSTTLPREYEMWLRVELLSNVGDGQDQAAAT
jgi:hypothetical protein